MALRRFFAITSLVFLAAAVPSARAQTCSSGQYVAEIAFLNQALANNQTVTVQAGQFVSLYGNVFCVGSTGEFGTTMSWSEDKPTHYSEGLCPYPMPSPATTGFPCGAAIAFSTSPSPPIQDPYFSFYFMVPGQTETITFYGTVPQSNISPATITFTVVGPTSVHVAPTAADSGAVAFFPPLTSLQTTPSEPPVTSNLPFVGEGSASGTAYIPNLQWVASANYPDGKQGEYQWVGMIQSDGGEWIAPPYTGVTKWVAPTVPQWQGTPPAFPWLDTGYPYGFTSQTNYPGDTAQDGPGQLLSQSWGEVKRYFSSRMYLMWIPPKDMRCIAYGDTAFPCAVPITLGYIAYTVTYDTINTLMPISTSGSPSVPYVLWQVNGCSGANVNFTFTQSNQYPSWNTIGS